MLSQDSRSGAFASFDGRNRQELHSGDGYVPLAINIRSWGGGV